MSAALIPLMALVLSAPGSADAPRSPEPLGDTEQPAPNPASEPARLPQSTLPIVEVAFSEQPSAAQPAPPKSPETEQEDPPCDIFDYRCLSEYTRAQNQRPGGGSTPTKVQQAYEKERTSFTRRYDSYAHYIRAHPELLRTHDQLKQYNFLSAFSLGATGVAILTVGLAIDNNPGLVDFRDTSKLPQSYAIVLAPTVPLALASFALIKAAPLRDTMLKNRERYLRGELYAGGGGGVRVGGRF